MNPLIKNLKDGLNEKGLYLNSRAPLFEMAVLDLELDEKLRPAWFTDNRSGPIFFPVVYKNAVKGDVLVFFIRRQDKFPAVVKQGDKIIFNFDVEATIKFLLNEQYLTPRKPLSSFLPFHYHLVPAGARMLLKKAFILAEKKIPRRDKISFPSWPVESSVEALRHIFLNCAGLLNNMDTKLFPPWPAGKKFTVILSHDIDTNEGFRNIDKFAEIERRHNFRSCWFVVGRFFAAHKEQLATLLQDGFEIGCHDYLHDNRLTLLSAGKMKDRLLKCNEMLREFAVTGFRSPSLLRSRPMFEAVADSFIYDSSVPDTELFLQTAARSGCCSVFPYVILKGLIELPITLPLDSTLIALGFSPDQIYETWKEKLAWLKRLGGIAHIDTHAESHYCGNNDILKIYEKFLTLVSGDSECWIAKPQEAVLWWKKGAGGAVYNNG